MTDQLVIKSSKRSKWWMISGLIFNCTFTPGLSFYVALSSPVFFDSNIQMWVFGIGTALVLSTLVSLIVSGGARTLASRLSVVVIFFLAACLTAPLVGYIMWLVILDGWVPGQ